MGAVQVGEDPGDLVAEHAQQRQLGVLHDGDLAPCCTGGGGDLQADPAGADHDDPAAPSATRPRSGRWSGRVRR